MGAVLDASRYAIVAMQPLCQIAQISFVGQVNDIYAIKLIDFPSTRASLAPSVKALFQLMTF